MLVMMIHKDEHNVSVFGCSFVMKRAQRVNIVFMQNLVTQKDLLSVLRHKSNSPPHPKTITE